MEFWFEIAEASDTDDVLNKEQGLAMF